MKLHARDSLIVTAAALSLVLAACGSKNTDDDSSAGGSNSSGVGGASTSQGGVVNDATGGRAATGGKPATGGTTANPATSAAGGSAISKLPKACPGFAYDDTATGDDGGVCRGAGIEIEPSQFDIMIAMDRTMSMTYCLDGRRDACGLPTYTEPSRWDILQQSLQQFITNISTNMTVANQPRMGLRFFGQSGNPQDPLECDPATYASPQVAMQDFAGASTAITNAMNIMKDNLGGQTPWQPSLQGVLEYAQDWQKNHMERITVVLFVTDGYPTECNTDMDAIQNTVGEFYWGLQGDYNKVGKPNIRTYIMGVGGDFSSATRYNLDNVAYAGGTGQATIANSATDVSNLSLTLQNITNSNVACEFSLPPPPDGMILDIDKVQVIYEPFKGAKQEIGSTGAAGGCSTANGGWFYDNPADPKKVILCPCSCANLGAGRINVQFGCRPKPIVG